MKRIRLLLSLLLVAGALSWITARVSAQEGVLLKVQLDPSSNYCHMKFPAIRTETLESGSPVLKAADSGDIIDFYGPCDHDPIGKEEVQAQRLQYGQQLMGDYSSD